MANVSIKYNPYTVDSVISFNGREMTEDSKLHAYKNERLQVWMEKLGPILEEECNDDAIHITFHGTSLDYEDMKDYLSQIKHSEVTYTLDHIPAKETDDKFRELVNLFEEMQAGPFEDLKDAHITENFQKALGSEFEVSVIATMSSGKSTLINAMLGREFVPAKNEACTATIARIRDQDGMDGYTAKCLNQNEEVIYEEQTADLEAMKRFNEDERVSYIEVNGDIPFIQTRKANLILVDTPGPNNSRNSDHRDHTYRIIKNASKPMVLYVLNATQLATNDDSILLGSVAEAMKVGGKQSKDRFLFAVNKIDEYDTERADSIDEALRNIRQYLAQYGIDNPNVFPISAEMAKVIRLHLSGQALTRKQEKTLAEYDLFNDVPQMHLTKYAMLPESAKGELAEKARLAKDAGDTYGEALIHTGVPAIEEAINEYLDKYAITAKIKNAVDTFRKKIEEKRMLDMLLKEIEHNSEEKQRINERLQRVEAQLNEGKATERFKHKIQQLSYSKDTNDRIRKIKSRIDSMLQGKASEKMTMIEMDQEMSKLIRKVDNLQSDVITELEKLVNEGLRSEAEKLLAEYSGYIQSLMQDKAVKLGKLDVGSEKFILGEMPDASHLIEKHKRTEQEKVGEKWVDNEGKRWYKPWTWPQKKGYFRDIFEDREYVDGAKVFEEFIKPVRGNFYENMKKAEEHMQEESDRLKTFFLKELDKLELVIRQKVTELKELAGNNNQLEERIRNDRQKMEWLHAFQIKLDAILEI
ncbi:dynamin family protein [Paenibacillus mendelii]|uniref:Dynamin family protein n=1 Tax=Paenibacillus mendelii TaxID=206163 RepID=A0ABV6JIS6_9BACL|nr:dynamin family protein [Paenibacillus mendelii]MCQ6558483.1 dynamin family protein [Paenibacillus mendelii]